ncbi:hypothetical protein GCM10022271_14470 [Corallibacter vietnamensis]|uniref:Tetratricopeptide repeat protein n=2 Tax=Corallibacter vietnamensis TaxID=904130 RepID=A0ABP7H3H4_9FLAO
MKMNLFIVFYISIFNFTSVLHAQNEIELDSILFQSLKLQKDRSYRKSIKLLTNLLVESKEQKLYKYQFLALNNLGVNYYSMLDYGEALNNYLEAYKISTEHLNKAEEMTVLNNLAILYFDQGELAKSKGYFLKAYKLAQLKGDDKKMGMYSINLAIVANMNNELDKAIKYLNTADSKLKNYPSIAISSTIARIENLYKRNLIKEANSMALKTLNGLKAGGEEKFNLLLLISDIFESEGNLLRSKQYLENALKVSMTPKNKLQVFQKLAKLNKQLKEYDKAFAALDSVIATRDTINNLKNSALFESARVRFEIENYKNQLSQNKKSLQLTQSRLRYFIGWSVVILLLIAWALRNSIIKSKQRKIIHNQFKKMITLELEKKENDKIILERQLQNRKTMALLEEERLKNEIESRNRKLATKALQIANRNELIDNIINELTEQKEVLKSKQVTRKIKELKILLKSDNEWKDFMIHFEQVNNGFLKKLKLQHPNLNVNDVRYLCYLYMNLSNKEIASLFNVTQEAIRKRKERVSDKLNLPNSKGLYNYLSSI